MSRILLFINGVVLLGCAVFLSGTLSASQLSAWLTVIFLLLPFSDRNWQLPFLGIGKRYWPAYALTVSCTALIIAYKPDAIDYLLITLLLTALPEEWFFRAYFMISLQRALKQQSHYHNWHANVLTSLLFALMHIPFQGWFGLSVFLPSMFFGWLYQKTNELLLVVVMHAFFNLIYFVFIQDKVFG